MTTGKHLQQNVRARDVVARYGGEEFLIVLPNTTSPSAVPIVDRLRQQVERQVVYFEDQELPNINFSAGLGTLPN